MSRLYYRNLTEEWGLLQWNSSSAKISLPNGVSLCPFHWAMQQLVWLGCKVDYWNALSWIIIIIKRFIFKLRSLIWYCLQHSPQSSCLGTTEASMSCSVWVGGKGRGGKGERSNFFNQFPTGRDGFPDQAPQLLRGQLSALHWHL